MTSITGNEPESNFPKYNSVDLGGQLTFIIRLAVTHTSLLENIVISQYIGEMMCCHIVFSCGPRRVYVMHRIIDESFKRCIIYMLYNIGDYNTSLY